MLADISGLIGLIIFVVIAIVSALLKRKEEEPFELPPELKPRRDQPPPQQPPPVARRWEEELRELLGDRPAPPPIVRQQPPPPMPRTVRPEPAHEFLSESEEPHIEVSERTKNPRIEPTFQSFGGMAESGSRYSDASHLQERVTQHLAGVTRHRVGTTSVLRRETSADARELASMLRHPQTIRRAMLASIILGPPRALES
jgi:hypothetical protein